MKPYLLTLLYVSFSLVAATGQAEIKTYQSTDNTGLNKQERIDALEAYMTGLSRTLQDMEAKINENAKAISAMDKTLKSIVAADKEAQEKIAQQKAQEKKEKTAQDDKKKTPENVTEIEKLRADMLVLKNEDIERLKVQYFDLNESIKAIKATLHDQVKINAKEPSYGTKPR